MRGTAGTGGTAGGGRIATREGLYSSLVPSRYACLFVNEENPELVAAASCLGSAFRFLFNREGTCAVDYPVEGDVPQETPIADDKFEVETTRSDGLGEYTIRFSGESRVLLALRLAQDGRARSRAALSICNYCTICGLTRRAIAARGRRSAHFQQPRSPMGRTDLGTAFGGLLTETCAKHKAQCRARIGARVVGAAWPTTCSHSSAAER
jgi:hypothetical protein